MEKIKYREVMNLSPKHPLVKRFEMQLLEEEKAYKTLELSRPSEDDFNRYIAGDR